MTANVFLDVTLPDKIGKQSSVSEMPRLNSQIIKYSILAFSKYNIASISTNSA